MHSANASAPLHARVISTGSAAGPSSQPASQPCARVSGSTTCASIQVRRSRPKKPRLAATPRSANLAASDRLRAVSVGTGNLLHGDTLGAEGAAHLIDRLEALEPRRAGKDVEVDRPGFGPRVEDGVRLAENQ